MNTVEMLRAIRRQTVGAIFKGMRIAVDNSKWQKQRKKVLLIQKVP